VRAAVFFDEIQYLVEPTERSAMGEAHAPNADTWASNIVASAQIGNLGWSASGAGSAATRDRQGRRGGWVPERSGRARAPDSPMPGECMGEGGCMFDEIGNLVEPTERQCMDALAGPQRGRRSVAARMARARRRIRLGKAFHIR
jgi:hypothetical protein